MTTRFLGNCQICEGDFKLHSVTATQSDDVSRAKLVHHGFTRPGVGYIIGDCPGVDEPPYELSCNRIKQERSNVDRFIASERAGLARYEAMQKSDDPRDEVLELVPGYRGEQAKLKTHKRGEPPTTQEERIALYDFQDVLKRKVVDTKWSIRQAEMARDRYARRIAEWKPKPVRTLEEEGAKLQRERDARAAEAEARRREKAAKRAAIDAKHAAHAKKRQDFIDDAVLDLRALAAVGTPSTSRPVAIDRMRKLSKKVPHFYLRDLHIDDVLVAVGLATRNARGGIDYDYGYLG